VPVFRLIQKHTPLILLIFLVLSLLWKGGKTLEVTWILVAISWLCTAAYWSAHKNERDFVSPHMWGFLMCFVIWTVFSQLFSQTRNYGLDEVFRTGSLTLIFFWTARSWRMDDTSFRNKLFPVVACVTLISAIIGFAVYVFQPVNRFVGTFFDGRFHTDYWPNGYAEYLLLVWPVTIWWLLKQAQNNQKKIFFALICSGFLLSTLFLSYSRGALVAFIGQILLLAFTFYRTSQNVPAHIRQKRRRRAILLASSLAVISGMLFFIVNESRSAVHPVQNIAEKITFKAAEGTSSASERRQFWHDAFQLTKKRPLFGWGPYSFRFVHTSLQNDVFATSDHPHNWFLKIAAERGIPAALLLYAFLWILFIPLLKKLIQKSRKGAMMPEYHLPLILGPLGVLAHVLIDYNLQFVGVALPFWIFLGILAATHMQTVRHATWDHPVTRQWVCAAEVLLASLLLLLAIVEGRYLLLSSFGRHAEARKDPITALHWYDQARYEYFSRDLHLSRASLYQEIGELDQAVDAVNMYIMQNTHDARGWLRKGDIAMKQQNFGDARFSYEKAFSLGKWNHLGAARGLLQVFLREHANDAEEWTARIRSLLPFYLHAIERNTHFIALTPNVEEFLSITLLLARFYPDDAPLFEAMGAKTDREAREERERIAARPRGRLW